MTKEPLLHTADAESAKGIVMSRGQATFRQSDLERAIRAVTKAGAAGYDVVIEGARVIVRVADKARPQVDSSSGSWDTAIAELEST